MSDPNQPVVVDEAYILKRYQNQIAYYWSVSKVNKRAYKRFRSWTIILGALVTLISSMSAAEFIQSVEWLRILFAIATPVVAATLAIMGGMGQNFHWGATWRDMVLNASRLEKERDRFMATPSEKRDLKKELDLLNTIVIEETQNFFQRVLESEVKPKEKETS
ncbi:MAG: DUF4231 domain-containing protein [Anaerolineales bacterium]|jgi:hypothetical protein|nr:DUF4231 domain-containing protein [Anaerolineales bacterium]